jgi:hypothetical protein
MIMVTSLRIRSDRSELCVTLQNSESQRQGGHHESIRDAVAGSFLLGYLWLLSQLIFIPGLRDGLLQNPSGQLVFQQFTVIVGIVVAFYFVASGAVNVTAKLASARAKETSDAESKYEAFKPVELGEREYLARRQAAKQS